jgi:BirA family transcriptional regulator, biotin operon repressor / biotin---[acetyl-CoA-carboxylase] ligase
VGVNLVASPDAALVEPGAVPPVNVLAETGVRIGPEAFLDHLAPAFARWEAMLAAEGFGPLRAAWLAHAARLGQVIRARTGTQSREGVFETLDETGALVLRMGQAVVAIPAAEVFF